MSGTEGIPYNTRQNENKNKTKDKDKDKVQDDDDAAKAKAKAKKALLELIAQTAAASQELFGREDLSSKEAASIRRKLSGLNVSVDDDVEEPRDDDDDEYGDGDDDEDVPPGTGAEKKSGSKVNFPNAYSSWLAEKGGLKEMPEPLDPTNPILACNPYLWLLMAEELPWSTSDFTDGYGNSGPVLRVLKETLKKRYTTRFGPPNPWAAQQIARVLEEADNLFRIHLDLVAMKTNFTTKKERIRRAVKGAVDLLDKLEEDFISKEHGYGTAARVRKLVQAEERTGSLKYHTQLMRVIKSQRPPMYTGKRHWEERDAPDEGRKEGGHPRRAWRNFQRRRHPSDKRPSKDAEEKDKQKGGKD